MQNKLRPKFLDLFILAPKMSITAKASILHRISGVVLFLALPFILNILHCSLTNPNFYTALYGYMSCFVVKIIYLGFMWALIYHACCGVRFLFLDMHKGVEVETAKLTAYMVIGLSFSFTVLLGVLIW